GYLMVVVTNQPGPARGQYTRASVFAATARMHELLAQAGTQVDDVFICLHAPAGGVGGDRSLVRVCECRKPKPGLLLDAARKHHIDLGASFMIGDRDVDTEAGRAAGCKTIQIGREVTDLAAAADRILHT